ncbi:MAG TPA: polysaccharide lyase [Cyclobacteriaceae bacterium]|nr:polysaccharide lyase [Cyclobacteriaceae bacterium]
MNTRVKSTVAKLLGIPLLILGTVSCEMTAMEEPIVHNQNGLEDQLNATQDPGANYRLGEAWIFEETFEGNQPFSTAHGLEVGASHSLTFVNRPGASGKSARVELRDNDPTVKGSRRAEITIVKGEDGHIGKDTWYAFELYVPKDYIDEDDDEVINQWHQNGNASAAIRIKNGRFLWRFYIDGKKTDYDLGLIEKDTWNTFVVHMVHSYGSDGLTQIWINNQNLIDLKGRNINNDPLPKWKIGIYKSEWASAKTTTSKRVLYFDNVRVGDQNTSLEIMKGGLGTPSVPEADNQPEKKPITEKEPQTQPEAENKVPATETETSESGTAGLVFINAHTDKDINPLLDGGTLSLVEQGTYKISVRAQVSANDVGSVKFELSGAKSYTYIDNAAPFALFGDDSKGNYYYGPGLAEGKYSLKVTTYTGRKGSGSVIGTQTVNFTINNASSTQLSPEPVQKPESPVKQDKKESLPAVDPVDSGSGITGLTFVNAQVDKDITSLTSGATISLSAQGTHKISVRADVDGAGSVKFELSGAKTYTYIDNAAPYALFGDDSKGNYYYGPGLTAGNYSLRITTYTGTKASGQVVGSQVVHFTVQK